LLLLSLPLLLVMVNSVAHLGPGNVHAMAACIEQLRQLHKALHLVTPPAADDGCGKQVRNLPHGVPHLRQEDNTAAAPAVTPTLNLMTAEARRDTCHAAVQLLWFVKQRTVRYWQASSEERLWKHLLHVYAGGCNNSACTSLA
jgi:hypothetical protein